jgi:hypothetical protein
MTPPRLAAVIIAIRRSIDLLIMTASYHTTPQMKSPRLLAIVWGFSVDNPCLFLWWLIRPVFVFGEPGIFCQATFVYIISRLNL